MTISEAEKILSENCLDLSNAGLDPFPCKEVHIAHFEVDSKEDHRGTTPQVELLGLLPEGKAEGEARIWAMFVRDGSDYYFRDDLYEALEVVQAIRRLNGYDAPIAAFCKLRG